VDPGSLERRLSQLEKRVLTPGGVSIRPPSHLFPPFASKAILTSRYGSISRTDGLILSNTDTALLMQVEFGGANVFVVPEGYRAEIVAVGMKALPIDFTATTDCSHFRWSLRSRGAVVEPYRRLPATHAEQIVLGGTDVSMIVEEGYASESAAIRTAIHLLPGDDLEVLGHNVTQGDASGPVVSIYPVPYVRGWLYVPETWDESVRGTVRG
jgi:hypothetical protein